MSQKNQYQRFLAATAENPVKTKIEKTVATPAPVIPVVSISEPKKIEEVFATLTEEKVEEIKEEVILDEDTVVSAISTKRKK